MARFSKILGTGSYLPPNKVTNHDLAMQLKERGIETSDEWIFSRSGIAARHYAPAGALSSIWQSLRLRLHLKWQVCSQIKLT